ncbi:hydrogenase maturation protease [uncultured Rhodoblastus sp.]|uniref:hydrogenase maturation protease n=1 Tax=uncultured Rhodoblastus sp. TaxID=543037 RepID=UPI0025FADC29|nr:hydrogenase maturation protease [uncultured Rhodoblastus sp.]
MKLVVFGWGNISRGDDGVGPLLLARIEQAGWDDAVLIEDYQLQLEHALDLEGADLALFIDAGADTPAPFTFREIFACEGMTHTSHALAPESVLAVFVQVTGKAPPPAFLLGVRGENFELGAGLSPEGAARLELAWNFLHRLRQEPKPESWRGLAQEI